MKRVQEFVEPGGAVVRRRPTRDDVRWDGTRWVRWSGRRWAHAAYSLQPEHLTDPLPFRDRPEVTEAARRRALASAVEDQVGRNGATVVFDGPAGTTLGYPTPVHHGLWFVLTLLTGGIAGIGWVLVTLTRGDQRVRLEADAWGHVWAVPLTGR